MFMLFSVVLFGGIVLIGMFGALTKIKRSTIHKFGVCKNYFIWIINTFTLQGCIKLIKSDHVTLKTGIMAAENSSQE